MENNSFLRGTRNFFKAIETFYDNHSIKVFIILSAIFFWGASFRITNRMGCSQDPTLYIYSYLLVIMVPFIISFLSIYFEANRNKALGKESSDGFIHSLESLAISISFLSQLFIIYMMFFSSGDCGKFGDYYSLAMVFVGYLSCYIYGGYLIILALIAIIRLITHKRHDRKNKE